VRTISLQIFILTVGLGVTGCSGTDTSTPPGVGGSSDAGGATTVNGGSSAIGGVTSAGGTHTGGAIGAGGSPATGGASATGGNKAGGRTPATGGMPATGGAIGAGGTPATGGALATGGSKAGGGTPATGGMPATGGSKGTGGMPATGGMSATGGSKGTGGAPATGGTTSITPGKKFCGNITTGSSVDTGGMKFSKYWDQITPENAGKWGSVQSSATGAFNWGTLDAIYSYTNTNNIQFKQHNFVWGSQQPSGTPTQAQVENWIKSFCQRYPNTKLIDVVNEPPPHTTPNYTANLGAGESGTYPWITKAFKLARQYCGSAILILNDYNTIEYSTDESHFISIVSDIKSHGAPIDAVGAQAHDAYKMSASTIQTNINTLASQTSLPVYITEYDIPDTSDSNQLSIMQAQFPVFWNTSSVHGITYWGWIVGQTWKTGTGLVNGTSPRPAMTWLMGQLGRPVPPN